MKLPFCLFRISGHSMEPTVKSGSVVLVKQWWVKPQIGDVVVFKMGDDYWIKRIKFISEACNSSAVIRGDELVLEGDNKEDSLDSRSLGSLKVELVVGKVLFI